MSDPRPREQEGGEASDDGVFDPLHRLMLSTFKWHAAVFAVVCIAAVAAEVAGWLGEWVPWPVYAWGLLVGFQYCYVRATRVDDAWVEERLADLKAQSYDLGHIQDIEGRVASRDPSVRPSDERDD